MIPKTQPKKEKEPLVHVMAYFHCDKDLAQRIIKSSKANGEFDAIDALCKSQSKKEDLSHG